MPAAREIQRWDFRPENVLFLGLKKKKEANKLPFVKIYLNYINELNFVIGYFFFKLTPWPRMTFTRAFIAFSYFHW